MTTNEMIYKPTLMDTLLCRLVKRRPHRYHVLRQWMLGLILISTLIAFELFNFGTTEYAFKSLIGSIEIQGIGWATILALAFCGIDFAGLASLVTDNRSEKPRRAIKNVLLLGAWLLGAGMNAVMTWWAVHLTLASQNLPEQISQTNLIVIAPVFVAVLVWLTRILIISSLLMAADKAISHASGALVSADAFDPMQARVHRSARQITKRAGKRKRLKERANLPTIYSYTPLMIRKGRSHTRHVASKRR